MMGRASRTPVLLQSQAGESGAICLAMLLAHYGSFPKLTEVKTACDCGGNDEIPLEHLHIVTGRFGMDAQLRSVAFDELGQYECPLVLSTGSGKSVLLAERKGSDYILHDPEAGKRKVSGTELEAEFGGQVLVAKPGNHFAVIENESSFVQYISERIEQNRNELGYVLIAGAVMIIPAIVIPGLSRVFFDDIIIQGQTLWFKPMLMIMAAFLVLGCVLVFFQQWILLRIELKMCLVESAKFVTHILSVPYTYFQVHSTGDTVNRIKLNDTIASMLSRDFTKLLISLATVLVFAIAMINYSLVLTVVGVSIMLTNLLLLNYFSAKRTALNQALFQKQQRTFSTANEGIEHIETLKASGWENDFYSLWSSCLVTAINEDQKLGFTSRMLTVMPDFLTQLNNVVIVLLGGVLIIYGEISIGVFIAMQSFITNFAEPVKDSVDIAKNVQVNKSNINNLNDSLDEPVDALCEQKGRADIGSITPFNARLSGALEVKNISFGYSKFAPPLIEDFSLSLAPGQRVAFVGGSGSGKSTLLKVISGLYAPLSGEILYDGMNINSINSDVLRNSVTIVDQDIFLFTGSVSDNIVMWNRAIDHESITASARDAEVYEVIAEREGGYDARIAPGGGNFSGGQRQRMEIARALVTNPSVVFMDEATSALDAETEKRVMENIRKRNCTTITIAHRLSSIRDYDEIIVIDRGKVIQRGTHDELVRQKDMLYSRLVSEA